MKTISRSTFWILAALAALVMSTMSCNGIVTAEVEDPELCKVFPDQQFPGAGIFGGITTTVSASFTYDLGKSLPKLNDAHTTSDVKLLTATLTPKSGTTDLSFIQKLKIDLSSAKDGTTLPTVNVANYTAPTPATTVTELVIDGNLDTNLSPYIDEQLIKLTPTVTGTIPADSWTVDIKLCFYLDTKYTH